MIDTDNFISLYRNVIANYDLFFEPKESKVVTIDTISRLIRVITESYSDLCSERYREENDRLRDACGRYVLYISGYSTALTREELRKSILKFKFFCIEKNIKTKNFRALFIMACLRELSESSGIKKASLLAETSKIIDNVKKGGVCFGEEDNYCYF